MLEALLLVGIVSILCFRRCELRVASIASGCSRRSRSRRESPSVDLHALPRRNAAQELLGRVLVARPRVKRSARETIAHQKAVYVIDAHKLDSAFHRALHISYPSPADSAAAAQRGVKPGGDIMIHGLRKRFSAGWALSIEWSTGQPVAIAVTDERIEEIYRTRSEWHAYRDSP